MARRPGGTLAALILLAVVTILFLAGWCAGDATRGTQIPDQARAWLILALILVGALLISWTWNRIARRVARWFHER
jgi:multisubunit Na+/H+ antiporter MnhB subunit